MLIKQELADKIVEQVGNEFAASAQYLAIAVYFEQESMSQTAGFFYGQAEEEREHAMKLLKYVVETGGNVVLPAVPAPKAVIKSAEDAFQTSLNWELEVTGQINGLMDLAKKQNDYLAQNFLNWFVDEQLEEVTTMEKYLNLVRKMGDKNIFMLEGIIARAG
jgi:ferritin